MLLPFEKLYPILLVSILVSIGKVSGSESVCKEVNCGGYRTQCYVGSGLRLRTVDLKKQNSYCKFNFSYGFTERYIWVTRNCKATFNVCVVPSAIVCRTINCFHNKAGFATCTFDTYNSIFDVKPDESYRGKCSKKRNYRVSTNSISTREKCKARFQVCVIPNEAKCKEMQCSSVNGTVEGCTVKPTGSVVHVRILAEYGNVTCTRDMYGFGDDFIWVKNGCSAMFDVCSIPHNLKCRDVDCSSMKRMEQRCSLGSSELLYGIELKHSQSKDKCRYTVDYWVKDDHVVVSKGCRATFQMCTIQNPDTCRTVNCSSSNNGISRCAMDSLSAVTELFLLRQYSSASCIRGLTYGSSQHYMWVDSGCAASFRVCAVPICTNISCDSKNYHHSRCYLPPEYTDRTILKKSSDGVEKSHSPCYEDRYGFSEQHTWVSRGCRASFRVCTSEGKILCEKMFCASNGSTHECPVDEDRSILRVELLEEKTWLVCRRMKTYWANINSVFVSNGCSGIFNVCTIPIEDAIDRHPSEFLRTYNIKSEEEEEMSQERYLQKQRVKTVSVETTGMFVFFAPL